VGKLTFYDSIDRARLLTETTIDALGHINICIREFLKRRVYLGRHLPYFVVLREPSKRASLSMVIAWAGQMASQSLQAVITLNMHPMIVATGRTNASLLPARVSAEGVLSAEAW
jgi:hypothetical protein